MIAHALLLGPRWLLRRLGLRPLGGGRLMMRMLPLAVMMMLELVGTALVPRLVLIAALGGAALRVRCLVVAARTLRPFPAS